MINHSSQKRMDDSLLITSHTDLIKFNLQVSETFNNNIQAFSD